MLPISSPTRYNTWLLDSSATHHLPNNDNDLTRFTIYNGTKKVGVGNGSTQTIKSHGSSYLKTSGISSVLHLFDILHTPCVSSNLASISKLCKDKDTYVEFHLSDFFRKDSTSQAIHAQSNVAGGLCVF